MRIISRIFSSMNLHKKKSGNKKLQKESAFQLLLDKATNSVRKKALKRNQPIAISENGVVYLIFPDGRKVQQKGKLEFKNGEN